jgi:hypothetical protein
MKSKVVTVFWGIVLIVVALLLLAQELGYLDYRLFSDQAWVLVFGIVSAAFFLAYFLNGVRKWGWLFPALIFAGVGATLGMAISGLNRSYMATPILAAVAVPFYVGFALNPRARWALLIPAWVMTVPAVITLFADVMPDEVIGASILYGIALPFLIAFIFNRNRRWALIPAVILAVLGTLPLLATVFNEEVVGAAVMFLFALPFFVVYFWSRANWWALIPAGIFTSIGVVVVLAMTFMQDATGYNGPMTAVLFLGWCLTFGLLWLRRKSQPTAWAIYPSMGLFAAAVLAFLLGQNFQAYWPVALLVVGVAFLVTALVPRKKTVQPQAVEPPAPVPPVVEPPAAEPAVVEPPAGEPNTPAQG